ncbi:MAG: hypothetical protein OJF48_001911 [Afipia sp.]|nr:MAG: hypothetical protein OJF48_001911 [Afipia sp.]
MPDNKGQGIVRTDRGEEQPADKERAQADNKTPPGQQQRVIKEKPEARRADENDLPGAQDQGGKHGGQKDGPKPSPQPDGQHLDPNNPGPERPNNQKPRHPEG